MHLSPACQPEGEELPPRGSSFHKGNLRPDDLDTAALALSIMPVDPAVLTELMEEMLK